MDAIYSLQAEICRTLASPRRLEIIHALADGPCEVGRLAARTSMTQPNVSQHLAVMRAAGIVETERSGREVVYRLADQDVIRACELMRGVLLRRLARLAQLGTSETVTVSERSTESERPPVPIAQSTPGR